jgi:hypothetical protein
MNTKEFILTYLSKQPEGSNWYKMHRKFFGEPEYAKHLEKLEITLQQLEEEGLILVKKEVGTISTLFITSKGMKELSGV